MRFFVLASTALLTVACSPAKDPDKRPLGEAPAAPAAATNGEVTGTLLEQIPATPYVYLRLKTTNGDVWTAVNQVTLKIGDPVTVYGAIPMDKFESKTLNRVFERVYFGSLEVPGAPVPLTAGTGTPAPASVGTPPAVDAHVAKVEKASGANAHTIGELWTQKDALTGKTVSIRGVVVKYNAGVMGKNWIHLQDGSGDAGKGTHDITVTTLDAAELGKTVTITGTVRTNKDFGAGYAYALIVEDAKVVAK